MRKEKILVSLYPQTITRLFGVEMYKIKEIRGIMSLGGGYTRDDIIKKMIRSFNFFYF